MQQCKFVYTITRADCRACNGLDAGCRNYEPNPGPEGLARNGCRGEAAAAAKAVPAV